jgi:hypothetical protein
MKFYHFRLNNNKGEQEINILLFTNIADKKEKYKFV